MAKAVLKAVHHEIKRELDHTPSWVSERIEDFAVKSNLLPFVKNKPKNKLGSTTDAGPAAGYTIPPEITGEEGVEELGGQFQEFYLDLEEELMRRKWRLGKQSFGSRAVHANGSVSVGSASSGDEKEKEKEAGGEEKEGEDQVEHEKEKRVRDVMENVERTVCSVFYDRYTFCFASLHRNSILRVWLFLDCSYSRVRTMPVTTKRYLVG